MHISLDSALGRQRRLNQIGETISLIAAPTAAYSLRSLTGGDPKVVRVRRESDNHEQDFTASEVSSGALVDFVNAQVTAPLDIQELTATGRDGDFLIAKAAYSLRSLGTRQATVTSHFSFTGAAGDSATYNGELFFVSGSRDGKLEYCTGDGATTGACIHYEATAGNYWVLFDYNTSAVLSRSSDSTDDNPWDATWGATGGNRDGDLSNATFSVVDGKYVCQVRRSSDNALKSFTADEITDGTLLSFVNEDLGITFGTAEATTNGATLTNASNTGFTYTSSDTNLRGIRLPFSQSIPPGATISVTITTSNKTSGMTPSVRFARDASSQLADSADPATLTFDSTGTQTLVGKTTSTTTSLAFFDDVAGSFDISNVVINSIVYDGFVSTWYDQSVSDQAGSATGNHATQGTASAQPKIVENGSFLTSGVKFEGAQTLSASDPIITAASTGDNSTYSAFSIQTVATSEDGYLYGNASGSNGTSIYALSTPTFTISNTSATNLDNITRSSGQNLLSAVYNSGDAGLLVNGAGTMSDSGTYNFSAGSSNFIIGNRNSSSADAAFLTGSINEIIIYNSNQSANRTAIEANIGLHYNINLPDGVDPTNNEVNGFVETWYDQFGNNDAVQTTATEQPMIVDSGNLITGGGIFFDGSNDQLDFTALNASDLAIFTVLKFDAVSSQKRILGDSSDNSEGFGIGNATNGFFRGNGGSSLSPSLGATISTSGDFLYSLTRVSDTITFFTKGTASGTNTRSDAFKADSIGGSTNPIHGNLKEIIIYTSDQSSNRLAIEANITSHYGIS